MTRGTARRRRGSVDLSAQPERADGAPARPGGWAGARTALIVYLVLLLVLPQQLIIAPLGFTGSPATVWGLGCFLWWTWYHVNRAHRVGAPRAVRWAALLVLATTMLSYTHAMMAPMASDELSVADAGLLRMLSWLGVLLLGADGIADLDDWRSVLDWFMILIGALALLGMAQALTGQAWVDTIHIPGLTPNTPIGLTDPRDGHPRPVGTATHAIEFGQILTMGLLVSAAATSVRPTLRNRAITILCAAASVMMVSRSAVVSIVVGSIVLGLALTRRQKIRGAILGFSVLLAAFMLRPGLLGTTGRLFTGITGDASARSRTDSYSYAIEAFASHPIVGKGFGTFLPKYRILDNQWLLSAIEVGVLGVTAVLLLMGAVVMGGLRAERSLPDRADQVAVRGLTASIVAVCVGMLFYDGFSFPQATGLLFVVCGAAAAASRISQAPTSRHTGVHGDVVERS